MAARAAEEAGLSLILVASQPLRPGLLGVPTAIRWAAVRLEEPIPAHPAIREVADRQFTEEKAVAAAAEIPAASAVPVETAVRPAAGAEAAERA